MRHLKLKARLRDRKAAEVFSILCDLERYPSCTDAVKSLTIIEKNDERWVSKWEVGFQKGRLRWTEEDLVFPDKCLWRFRQLEGDAAHFAGEWEVRDEDNGCSILFTAEFQIGFPGLEAMFGPIAEKGLRENIRSMVRGLFGDSVQEIE